MSQPDRIATLLTLPLANRLISARELSARLGRPCATFYRWEATGRFPRRMQLQGKCVAWRGEEIQAWIDERLNVDAYGPYGQTRESNDGR
jgi:predicted DNA-binding transcriptional regulator AlpA